jgi:hypothetical protein
MRSDALPVLEIGSEQGVGDVEDHELEVRISVDFQWAL